MPRRVGSAHAPAHHHCGDEPAPERGALAPGHRANRRVVLKAVAGMAALTASGVGVVPSPLSTGSALAQDTGGTRATRFVPADNGIAAADAAQGEWATFQADYPFWALGASWNGDVGLWPVIAIQLSQDGETWTESIDVAAETDDGGQPTRDDRLFTPLIFTDGAQWVRYQTIDIDRVPGVVEGLSFVYIDPTDGPWAEDIAPVAAGSQISTLTTETMAPPEIVTREQWGANENWRFLSGVGEVWPPEYETVTHIIIHHTATANRPVDVPGAIRSIYYYHAVEQGWGDIGYNYLVDHNGRIYQGRYGGQNVIGGHSYQFAIGSSGITTIGNFMAVDPTEAALSALVSICAWVGRDIDPLGNSDFHEAADLPNISSHRDVNATTCPGDRLWNDLPEIRQLVAQTLEDGVLDTELPAGIVVGDRVRVQTGDGLSLNLRASAGGAVTGSLADGAHALVTDGPTKRSDGNWYFLEAESGGASGWATAQFLLVDPDLIDVQPGDLPYGLNLRTVQTVNLRRAPSTSAGIVASLPSATWAHVMAGPLDAGGQEWYQIRAYQYGDGWVIRSAIEPAPLDTSPDAEFAVGDTVEATQSSNVRPRYGIANGTIATAGTGTRMTITVAPVEVTGYIWYGVYSTTFGGGWVVEDYLRASTPPPAGKFQINDTFRVTEPTNLRSTPTTSGSVLVTMQAGTTGTVIGGPRTANGYTWWQVRLSSGTTGWCIENWLVETDGGTTPPPSTKFKLNDAFRVAETVNLRSAPGTSASVKQTLTVGTTGTIIGGPTSATGYVWWNLRLTNGTVGWSIEGPLEKTTTTPPPTGKFEIGDNIRVTENLNLRSAASTAGSVVAVLPANTTGKVLGGPTAANGYTWWNIQTSLGTGWAVEDWLAESGGTTPPPSGAFEIGDTVSVTERANFRTGAGTSNSVIRLLQVGESGTVTAGPSNANGFVWWQIQTSNGTGWVIEDVLVEGTTPPPPSGGIPAGATVRVNSANLRLRSAASTSGTVLAVLPLNHQMTVISGPTSAGGYQWYRVNSTTYGTGYVASEFITQV